MIKLSKGKFFLFPPTKKKNISNVNNVTQKKIGIVEKGKK